jgi:hypothetical protein
MMKNSLQRILKIGVSDLDAGLELVLEEEEEDAVWVVKTASGEAFKKGGEFLSSFKKIYSIFLIKKKYKTYSQSPAISLRQNVIILISIFLWSINFNI